MKLGFNEGREGDGECSLISYGMPANACLLLRISVCLRVGLKRPFESSDACPVDVGQRHCRHCWRSHHIPLVLITGLATFSLELASATWTSVPSTLVQLDSVQLGVKSHESSSVLILSCDRLPEPVSRLAPFPTYLRPYRAVEDAYSTVSLVEHVDQPRSN